MGFREKTQGLRQ